MILKLYDKFTGLVTRQLSPSLQYAAALIFIALGCWFALGLQDRLTVKQEDLIVLERQKIDLSTIEPKAVWVTRLESANKIQREIQSDLWKGESLGVISATLGQRLRLSIDKHKPVPNGRTSRMIPANITIDPELEFEGDDQPILRFDVTARINRGEIDDLLLSFSNWSPTMYLTDLRVTYPSNQTVPAVITFQGYVMVSVEE